MKKPRKNVIQTMAELFKIKFSCRIYQKTIFPSFSRGRKEIFVVTPGKTRENGFLICSTSKFYLKSSAIV